MDDFTCMCGVCIGELSNKLMGGLETNKTRDQEYIDLWVCLKWRNYSGLEKK